MGCDFSHSGLRMSYGGFHNLVKKLAAEAGIPLRKMEGYGGTVLWNTITDPLVPLLTGFDEYGGGEIPGVNCLALSRRIRELADRWSSPKHPDHDWRESANALAHALGEAAFLGEQFYWF